MKKIKETRNKTNNQETEETLSGNRTRDDLNVDVIRLINM